MVTVTRPEMDSRKITKSDVLMLPDTHKNKQMSAWFDVSFKQEQAMV